MAFINREGEKHNRLTIGKYAGQNKFGKSIWECTCECGNVIVVTGTTVINGHTKSCGCFSREKQHAIRHGDTKARMYGIWESMRARCFSPNVSSYKWYGARGIKVCDEWNSSYDTFKKWCLENGYANDLTIDRIDNDGDYEPGNCRWTTLSEQMFNTRRSVRIELEGKILNLKQLSEICGIEVYLLRQRAKKGWTGEKLTQPLLKKRSPWPKDKLKKNT